MEFMICVEGAEVESTTDPAIAIERAVALRTSDPDATVVSVVVLPT